MGTTAETKTKKVQKKLQPKGKGQGFEQAKAATFKQFAGTFAKLAK